LPWSSRGDAAGVRAGIEIAAPGSYDDALTRRQATLTATRSVQFSRSRRTVIEWPTKGAGPTMRGTSSLSPRTSVEWSTTVARREAAQQMRQQAAELRKMAETYGMRAYSARGGRCPPKPTRWNAGRTTRKRKAYRADSARPGISSHRVEERLTHGGIGSMV